jgi:hypothetical protein
MLGIPKPLNAALRVLSCYGQSMQPTRADVALLRQYANGTPESDAPADELACYVVERELHKLCEQNHEQRLRQMDMSG